jgi:N-acetylneuraminic acid mutarotase
LNSSHLENMKLTILDCGGDVPSARCDCSSAIVNGDIWLFGGSNTLVRPMKDLYTFNIEKQTWKLVQQKGSIPKERSGASMVHCHDKLFLMGGG